jgi:hypothetical protein
MPRTGPGWYTATSSRPTSWSTNAPAGLRMCTCRTSGRADQYALAWVAYQLLTGGPPFQRDQGMAVRAEGRQPGSALLRLSAFLEETGLVGEYDRLDPVPQAELLQDVRDMCLDGRLADVQPLPDL